MTKRLVFAVVMVIALISFLFFPFDLLYQNINTAMTDEEKQEQLKEAQMRLRNWNYYSGEADGSQGLKTINALLAYQKSNNLTTTGNLDGDTLNCLGMSTYSKPGYAYGAAKASPTELLARAINGESRGEPYEGQVAVGAVILNRTKDSKFPKTIAGVIYQPGAFTAVADGQINVPLDPKSSVEKAARDAMNGWDPTNGCIYYWNPATATSKWIWSRQIVKRIGKHNFGK